MMVVHEDNERPVEVPVIRSRRKEQKAYIIVKNHVRELQNITENTSNTSLNEDTLQHSSGSEGTMKKKRKSAKTRQKSVEMPVPTNEGDFIDKSTTEIDSNDLNELKTIYTKCKEVIERIETKYGHLLNLDSDAGSSSKAIKRKVHSETSEDECNCKIKKKIVFDEDGRQSTIDMVSEKHICVNKVKSVPIHTQNKGRNIAVEYQDAELELPDDLQTLGAMLQDPHIEKTYRNKVLEKMRTVKQEYVNEIRFNRHILIEKLKSNPDEVLDFKGTNLSTLPGYS